MSRPLGGTAEDAERWWQAYQLAKGDQAGELRQRAGAGDEHARRQLASWLADRARTEEAIEVIPPTGRRRGRRGRAVACPLAG